MMSLRMRAGAVLAAVAMAASVAGCGSNPDPTEVTVTGIWGESTTEGSPYVSLHEDGTLTGFDGCNRMMGNWVRDGNDLSFRSIATTRMFCEGVDTSLSTMVSALVDGDMLEVRGDGGDVVATLAHTSDVPEIAGG